jgi:hypothetical protein
MLETKQFSWDDPTLTLENYSEKSGQRFRCTKEQKERNLSREQAFQEKLNVMKNREKTS